MVLWVVMMIVPYMRLRSNFLPGISNISGFLLGAWKLLKRSLGEDLLQSIFSQSSSYTVCRRGLEELGRVGSVETEN